MRTCFYCFLGMLVCIGATQAEPKTQIGASYYYVEGSSALVLSAQMDNKGPLGVDGRRHPARTKWRVQWRFRHNMHGDVCQMEKVSVMVGVTTIRPRWRDEAQGPATLRKRWKQMLEAVDRNVSYHQQRALEAGKKIENVLNVIAPKSSCAELTEAANTVATEILATQQNESREFDLRTDYGRRNGVSLI